MHLINFCPYVLLSKRYFREALRHWISFCPYVLLSKNLRSTVCPYVLLSKRVKQSILTMSFRSILQQYWGYPDFRGIQADIIRSIAEGRAYGWR